MASIFPDTLETLNKNMLNEYAWPWGAEQGTCFPSQGQVWCPCIIHHFPSPAWAGILKRSVGMGTAHRYALETSWQGLLTHRLGGGGDEVEFPEANNSSKVANLAPLSPDEKLSILGGWG